MKWWALQKAGSCAKKSPPGVWAAAPRQLLLGPGMQSACHPSHVSRACLVLPPQLCNEKQVTDHQNIYRTADGQTLNPSCAMCQTSSVSWLLKDEAQVRWHEH
jgi:hypothetical protein